MTSTDTTASPVMLYWRPGCPYCSGLKRRLRPLGVRTTEVNIWADPDAAALLRSVAGGNETVPTVIIGGTAMVNPTGQEVLRAARQLAPEAVDHAAAESSRSRNRPALLVIVAWLIVIASVTVSFTLDAYGYANLSWGLDLVAVAAYLVVRLLRRAAGDPEAARPPYPATSASDQQAADLSGGRPSPR